MKSMTSESRTVVFPSPESRHGDAEHGLTPGLAILGIAGVLLAAGLASSRYTPDPTHPRIQRWYSSLDKPSYKPPDPLFGAIWPLLQTLHSVGAYRLMRAPASKDRRAALTLWLADIALVAGWGKLFFGQRSLTGGVVGAAALVASSLAFIERAARVDGKAAALAVPFALWSAFGGLMAEDLRERNPALDGRDPGLWRRALSRW